MYKNMNMKKLIQDNICEQYSLFSLSNQVRGEEERGTTRPYSVASFIDKKSNVKICNALTNTRCRPPYQGTMSAMEERWLVITGKAAAATGSPS